MNIELNNELIERCNNQSMYNRGTHIKESAESDYKKFIDTFSSRTLNPQQLEIVKKRTEQFKELITNIYNEYLSISANFVPVNVAGPAKYNSNKFEKIADRMDKKIDEINDKINKFYDNTENMLKNAYSKDEIILKYKDLYDFKEIIPLSALKKDGISELIKTLKKYLPDNVMYFPLESLTNTTLEFRISEIIREKVLRLTEDEVPHAITCITTNLVEQKDKMIIDAVIIVERDSLKSIIIGKKGSMLKEIGSKARMDIEKMTNKKVYLNLLVKTIKNWRDKEKYLKELGFYDIDE